MDTEDLRNRFEHHPPETTTAVQAHEAVRGRLLAAALELNEFVPDGREKSLMVTHLEDAMMWANAAIARAS